jgi:hypothetical protein
MISEMNNVDELFRQNMTEFLKTDIDGSLDFLLNAITIESLDKYLKTFYTTPPLDIEQISFIWDQHLPHKKAMDSVNEEVWELGSKATTIPFSIFTSMFHQHFMEHRFLELTLELLQKSYLQTKSIAQDYKVLPGDQSKFCLRCLCCGKKITQSESIGKILVNCLSYLASSRTITLTWGATKKEYLNQRSVLFNEGLQVGDHVVVENHGEQWPHKVEIFDIDTENSTA